MNIDLHSLLTGTPKASETIAPAVGGDADAQAFALNFAKIAESGGNPHGPLSADLNVDITLNADSSPYISLTAVTPSTDTEAMFADATLSGATALDYAAPETAINESLPEAVSVAALRTLAFDLADKRLAADPRNVTVTRTVHDVRAQAEALISSLETQGAPISGVQTASLQTRDVNAVLPPGEPSSQVIKLSSLAGVNNDILIPFKTLNVGANQLLDMPEAISFGAFDAEATITQIPLAEAELNAVQIKLTGQDITVITDDSIITTAIDFLPKPMDVETANLIPAPEIYVASDNILPVTQPDTELHSDIPLPDSVMTATIEADDIAEPEHVIPLAVSLPESMQTQDSAPAIIKPVTLASDDLSTISRTLAAETTSPQQAGIPASKSQNIEPGTAQTLPPSSSNTEQPRDITAALPTTAPSTTPNTLTAVLEPRVQTPASAPIITPGRPSLDNPLPAQAAPPKTTLSVGQDVAVSTIKVATEQALPSADIQAIQADNTLNPTEPVPTAFERTATIAQANPESQEQPRQAQPLNAAIPDRATAPANPPLMAQPDVTPQPTVEKPQMMAVPILATSTSTEAATAPASREPSHTVLPIAAEGDRDLPQPKIEAPDTVLKKQDLAAIFHASASAASDMPKVAAESIFNPATTLTIASTTDTFARTPLTINTTAPVHIMHLSAQPAALQAVADNIIKAHMSQSGVTVRLDPPEMGNVTINFQFDSIDRGVTAIVRSDVPETAALLRDRADILHQALKDSGFDNINLSFEQNDQSSKNPFNFDTMESASHLFATEHAANDDTPMLVTGLKRALGDGVQIDLKL